MSNPSIPDSNIEVHEEDSNIEVHEEPTLNIEVYRETTLANI